MARLTGAKKAAFLRRMRAGRLAARRRRRGKRGNPGRRRIHTKKFDRAVRDVKKSLKRYHRKGNAYAIAMHSLGERRSVLKGHRRRAGNPAHYYVAVRPKHGPGRTLYLTREHLVSSSRAAAIRFPTMQGARRSAQHLANELYRARLGSRLQVVVHG